MERFKSNQTEIIVLAVSWLLLSMLVGLYGSLDDLEASTMLPASTAFLNGIRSGTILFLLGTPLVVVLHILNKRV